MLNVMSALGLLLLMPEPTNTLRHSGVLSGFRRAWPLSLLGTGGRGNGKGILGFTGETVGFGTVIWF